MAAMRAESQGKPAAGAIWDLVVGALWAQKRNDPTLRHMMEYSRQVARSWPSFESPRPKTAGEIMHSRRVVPRRLRPCWF